MSFAEISKPRITIQTETLVRGVLGLMLGLSCVSFIEPSPYEFFFFILFPVALLDGLFVTGTTLTLFFLLFVIVFSQFLSLIPHFQHRGVDENGMTPALYTVYSVYLYISCFLFSAIFSKNSYARLSLAVKAYAFSCVFAGVWSILSFLNVAGLGDREPITGRVAGPFKDPNVMGSYCIMGVLFFVQSLLIHRRFTIPKLIAAGITFAGVFFSLSRGSLGAMFFGLAFLLVATFLNSDRVIKRRMIFIMLSFLGLIAIGGAYIATDPSFTENVGQRAKLEQEYDGGETGRFGNQKRSIPMLIERPFGFGAFRFPTYFGLQPHNSYIGAFADAGWIGGFGFIILVLSTSFLGVRLCIRSSPYRRIAHVVTPAALGFFLQGLQIDIDHWRFVLLMIGAIWGMESARRNLLEGGVDKTAPSPIADP